MFMASGALDLTEPRHLLAKLSHEIDVLTAQPRNSYAAINALRDAYHLREWIWHGQLKRRPALQARIIGKNVRSMTKRAREREWTDHIFKKCKNCRLIGELCNGSKHFGRKRSAKVKATLQAGYGSPLMAYGTGVLGYGVDGIFVQLRSGRIHSVLHLLQSARDYWTNLFAHFPQLG
jgi:hypothetical protein